MRLDKLIAQETPFSRSQVRQLIKAGRITVITDKPCDNSKPLAPSMHLPSSISVFVDGEEVKRHSNAKHYWMLNKSSGVICAKTDAHRPTVLDAAQWPSHKEIQIVGRLDKDTTGLLLLTNDGQWNHQVAHSKRDVYKSYQVTLERPISTRMIEELTTGVFLKKEAYVTQPARVITTDDPQRIHLLINEGKYHQVKRMLLAVGNAVTHLHRDAIGNLKLDPNLKPGTYRALDAIEIKAAIGE